MRHPRTATVWLFLLFVAAGCTDRDLPTTPAHTAPVHAGDAVLGVSDGVHDGTDGFYFLPPLVESPAYDGTFDAALQPIVEICETPACDALHARFSMTEGSGSEMVRLVEEDEHYIVGWHSRRTGAEAGETYRVRVLVGDVVLGHADVAVVRTGREARSARAAGSIALIAGRTLPVRLRIETGIVGAVVVSPAEATIEAGGTQQFSAALQDLHGEPITGPAVTWSSDDPSVAVVDGDGLATGVARGVATITAGAGPASGSARLTVTGPFVVNTTDDVDDGTCDVTHCSLREAILASNAAPPADEIHFGIPGPGPHTIRPATLLPAIEDPVSIDGYTQPGASPNTNGPEQGSDAVLMVELDGTASDDARWGLRLWSDDSTVRGLVVNGWGEGVQVAFGDRNRVQGSFIGTDVTGTEARPNGNGVRISAGAAETVIGTDGDGVADMAERNLISGNSGAGVHISQGSLTHETDRNVVAGNLIGTDVTGVAALPNEWGVTLVSQTNDNRIGTDADGVADEAERNVISGNVQEGVRIVERPEPVARPHRTVVAGNHVGADVTGTRPLGNGGTGILIARSPDNVVVGNLLWGNGGAGVVIGGPAATGNRILDNVIVDNGGLAIDLGGDGVTPNDAGDTDEGPNRLQNFPVLTDVAPGPGTLTVAGQLESTPDHVFVLQFFAGPCDESGHGEAPRLVGEASVTTDGSGLAGFSETFGVSVPHDAFVSATATDEDGNTSELSRCQASSGAAWHPLGAGMDHGVLALTVHDDDLVAGGSFSTAGGTPANRIARWDGSAWQPLGAGMNDQVRALTVHDGELIAGGFFTAADGQAASRIARWDGAAWQPLGSGMSGPVLALAVHDGELVAGGSFTTAGGETVNRVARWDGSAWQPIGTGLNGAVFALTVLDGELIAGGGFSFTSDGAQALRVARWDGSAWQPMGTGMNDVVLGLAVHGGQLIAGGAFDHAGGQAAHRIARWDGSAWQSMGVGMNHNVLAVTIHGSDLIAGGRFITAGGEEAHHIARWDGSTWQPLGTGMDHTVVALTTHDGDLIAGGLFGTAGGQTVSGIARWGPP